MALSLPPPKPSTSPFLIPLSSDAPAPDPASALHRDAATVFPKRTAAAVESTVGTALAAAGALKFVTEAELASERAALGCGGGGAPAAPDPSKPLAAVLAAARAAKQEAFDAAWKEMKVGTNRPLGVEEAAFLADLADADAAAAAAAAAAEREEVAAFQAAAAAAAEARAQRAKESAGGLEAGGAAVPAAVARPPPPPPQPRRLAAAVVKKAAAPAAKRPRSPSQPAEEAAAAASTAAPPPLAGLLGGYGSGSGSESE